jgi:hypothetical protein
MPDAWHDSPRRGTVKIPEERYFYFDIVSIKNGFAPPNIKDLYSSSQNPRIKNIYKSFQIVFF